MNEVQRRRIMHRARAQADADVLDAIDAARAQAAGPEYTTEDTPTGRTFLVPSRAIAAGMLDFLEAAYARAHPR